MSQQWLSITDAAKVMGTTAPIVRLWVFEGRIAWRFDGSGKQVLVSETGEAVTPQQIASPTSRRLRMSSLTVVLTAGLVLLFRKMG